MRRSIAPALALLVPLSFAVAACDNDGPDAAPVSADDLDGRTFVSRDVRGQTLAEDTEITIAFDNGSLAAVAGCNTSRGPYELDGSTLTLGDPVAQTQMACEPDRQAQDEWLVGFLQSGPDVELQDTTLTLTAGDVIMELEDQAAGAGSELDGTAWTFDSLDGPDGTLTAPEGAYVVVDGESAAISTGCNQGTTSITVTATTITVAPMAVTLRACESDAVGEWESALLGFLDGELEYTIDGDTATLTDGETTLTLTALA